MIDKNNVEYLTPHRGKMLMVSRVRNYNLKERTLTAEYDNSEKNIFYDSALGGLPGWACFEIAAQTISLLSGITRRELGLEPDIGMILSVSGLEIHKPLVKGKILIDIQQVLRLDAVYTFDCFVYQQKEAAKESIANMKMTVLDVDNIGEIMAKKGLKL
jgi:predicted hotdog family 3-hydroxylacyl-ACP dehydratase